MHPEVEELRPKLKELLYDCAVEIRATKAALFLLDPAVRRFELAADYGFRAGIRPWAGFHDPLVDRCGRGKTPFFVNSVGAEPKLSELLFESSTNKLLVAPMFSRGTLVGFIDMRDKAAQALFEQSDVAKAQAIVDRILNLFATKNVFGQRFITLAEAVEPAARSAAPAAPVPAATPPPPEPLLAAPAAPSADLERVISQARRATAQMSIPAPPPVFGEEEISAARDILRSILLLPGAVVTSFAVTQLGIQEVAAKGTLTDEALQALHSKIAAWLSKRGETATEFRTNVQTPHGQLVPPLQAAHLQKVFTAPVTVGSMNGSYLTVAFSENPDRTTHELLAAFLNALTSALEASLTRSSLQLVRARAAEKILAPDFADFAELRRHSHAVAARSERFARYLNLSPQEIETVRLTALTHDAGMRLLDYDRLYRKQGISEEELDLLRQHVFIGAALVEPLLGREVARAVLCHHERFDGGGYPNALAGEDIPLVSRLVQICDTYVAMTDPQGYQVPESHQEAMAAIHRGAGGQFDPQLVARFAEVMKDG